MERKEMKGRALTVAHFSACYIIYMYASHETNGITSYESERSVFVCMYVCIPGKQTYMNDSAFSSTPERIEREWFHR